MEKITSSQNSKFKNWKKLLEPKLAKKLDYFLMSGSNWKREVLENNKSKILSVLHPEGSLPLTELDEKLQFVLSNDLFSEMDLFGTKQSLFLIQKPKIETYDQSMTPRGLRLMLPLGEPSNMGALLRNAAAFGVKEVVLLKEACSPFHPKAVRAAAGQLFCFQYFSGPSIHELSPSKNRFFLDAEGNSIHDTNLPAHMELLVGEEGPGIPQAMRSAENILSIKTEANVESLNATFAASIAIYEHYMNFNNHSL